MNRVNLISGLAFCFYAASIFAAQPLPELRDLNLEKWDCLHHPGGSAKDPADIATNRMKNRDWTDVSHIKVPQWDFRQFVTSVQALDAQLGGHSRTNLTPTQAATLAKYENKIVSLTGYVALAYPAPGESCNCDSDEFHDWHLELLPRRLDHMPKIGDPTPIICEVTPRTESHLYQSGVRLQKLAGFMQLGEPPHIQSFSTGTKPHQVRITGYLMWDDAYYKADEDIGPAIKTGAVPDYTHPWRATAWEIHPILKIEDLGANE